MKVKGQKYNTMLAAMRAIIEHYGLKVIRNRYAGSGLTCRRMVWDVWRPAHNNLQYDDTHPFFANGTWTRITPHVAGFDMYSEDTHDTHIETALKRIALELGLMKQGETMETKVP
jgi:hypothetical protein